MESVDSEGWVHTGVMPDIACDSHRMPVHIKFSHCVQLELHLYQNGAGSLFFFGPQWNRIAWVLRPMQSDAIGQTAFCKPIWGAINFIVTPLAVCREQCELSAIPVQVIASDSLRFPHRTGVNPA